MGLAPIGVALTVVAVSGTITPLLSVGFGIANGWVPSGDNCTTESLPG